MNRLLKYFVMFVLPFLFLFINVSYAEFGATPVLAGSTIDRKTAYSDDYFTCNNENISYNMAGIYYIIANYYDNPSNETYKVAYDGLIDYFRNTLNSEIIISTWSNGYRFYFFDKDSTMSVGFSLGYNQSDPGLIFDTFSGTATLKSVDRLGGVRYSEVSVPYTSSNAYWWDVCKSLLYSTVSIKNVSYTNNVGYTWDGSSYYYEVSEEPEEEKPVPPSNSEIAQAVQNFYNSDYYKNNKDFKDFIVMYNYKTKYFDFIGHNFENKLGQQIIDAGVSIGSPPVSYNERWWHYYIVGFSEFTSTLFNKYYWLYSTNDFGENIKYEGKGSINDLLDLHFSTSSIIVYSTTNYPVNTVFKNENDEIESSADMIQGDQYTYDENLDPTTNEYDPLTNFIPTDPSQSILGDVDFDEINKVFEENKDILNIENASWLFTANNQLVNYFIGFLSFLIVLIIISRLLGG